jgi:hypothetical protein
MHMNLNVPEVANHAHAAGHGSQKGRHATGNLITTTIIDIIVLVIIVLSLVQLIAIKCNNDINEH